MSGLYGFMWRLLRPLPPYKKGEKVKKRKKEQTIACSIETSFCTNTLI
jgi:hypothetical protein